MEDDDMGLNWMPVYTRDILASCADMTCSQFGGYMRLLLYAWDSGGLPNDMEACCRIAGGMTAEDWAACRRRLVVLDGGTSEERLSHPRLEAERAKQQSAYDRKVAGVAKARAARSDAKADDRADVRADVRADIKADIRLQPEPEPEPDSHKRVGRRAPRARRTPVVPLQPIGWTSAEGFTGITDTHLAAWKVAYPLVNLERAQARAHANLLVTKKRYSSIGQYLANWFRRDQDDAELQGVVPAPKAGTFRPDAGREMSASEYAAWKRERMNAEYLRSKERKRSATSIGELIDERREA